MKNIVICCDGTANQFGEKNSNVVKLYAVLNNRTEDQIAYYDPGVGTLSEYGKTGIAQKVSVGWGLAFGQGLKNNIFQAYQYLMEVYAEGDKIYFFGFSRGSYTIRVLTGLLKMCGLLQKGCHNLLPYAFKLFDSKDFKLAAQFKNIYSRSVTIHFVGVWDTVSSYGFLGNWKNFPYTAKNNTILHIRHAVAIDERRTFYKQNLFTPVEQNELKEVWFCGAHSDVGGSYDESESGLSKTALKWMVVEACQKGLRIDNQKYQDIVLGKNKDFCAPNPLDTLHESLKMGWWIGELLPRKLYDFKKKKKSISIPFGTKRYIKENATLHASVVERMDKTDYSPSNLPTTYSIEEETDLIIGGA